MATDTGIVTIYDLKNNGKPLTTHRTDAREFLAHKSGRWSTSPEKKITAVTDADTGADTGDDSGHAMALKEMTFKSLQVMAKNENIESYSRMSKAQLVEALIPKPEAPEEYNAGD